MKKTLRKIGVEGTYVNIIKAIYDKPTVNIILNGNKLKPFHLKLGTWQGCPLSTLLFNIVLKFLATAIRQNEELKVIQIVKVVVKLSIFPNYMILDIKDLKNSTPKLLDTINRFTNVAGYKINLQNSVAFYIPKMNRLRKNIWKQFNLK
jgi:hypothetical protein